MLKLKTEPKRPALALALTAIVFALGCVCLGLLSLYFSAGDHGLDLFVWYLTQPKMLVLNLIPFLLLGLLLLALLDRAWLAFLLDAAVCLFFPGPSTGSSWPAMTPSTPGIC